MNKQWAELVQEQEHYRLVNLFSLHKQTKLQRNPSFKVINLWFITEGHRFFFFLSLMWTNVWKWVGCCAMEKMCSVFFPIRTCWGVHSFIHTFVEKWEYLTKYTQDGWCSCMTWTGLTPRNKLCIEHKSLPECARDCIHPVIVACTLTAWKYFES